MIREQQSINEHSHIRAKSKSTDYQCLVYPKEDASVLIPAKLADM